MARPCPICKKISLQQFKLKHVLIDKCPKCKGIWLDGGELFEIQDVVEKFGDKYLDIFIDQGIITSENQIRDIDCPKCKISLRIQRAGKDKQTLIDRCPKCRGIWLDSGEIFEVLTDE